MYVCMLTSDDTAALYILVDISDIPVSVGPVAESTFSGSPNRAAEDALEEKKTI